MERRQFIKSAAAAAAAPLMPASVAKAFSMSSAHYTNALRAATQYSFVSATTLQYVLGTDAETTERIISQLKLEGVLGDTAPNGMIESRKFVSMSARLATQAIRLKAPDPVAEEPKSVLSKMRKIVAEDEELDPFLETMEDLDLDEESPR